MSFAMSSPLGIGGIPLQSPDISSVFSTGIGSKGFMLEYDGKQNYTSLGTLGNLGSNLSLGFYCKFDIQTTSTAIGIFGFRNNTQQLFIGFNQSTSGVLHKGFIRLIMSDNAGLTLSGDINFDTGFYDGNKHTIEITVTPSTNTIVFKIDGVVKATTYTLQQTPATFVNFTQNFIIGADDRSGAITDFFPCTIDNFQIGTSATNLYGSYLGVKQKGTGTTLTDTSGQGNDGTLSGSPVPLWGLTPMTSYALQFDGSQNYVSLGTLGNLGSNLGSGFYCKFSIKTTYSGSSNVAIFGALQTTAWIVEYNGNSGVVRVFVRNQSGTAYDTSSHIVVAGLNDGNKHTVTISGNPVSSNTVTVNVDGTDHTYSGLTPIANNFANFTIPVPIGARNSGGTLQEFLACTIDNFQIGTSAGSLYGNYFFDEGTGTAVNDFSGNANRGTLMGSPLPSWVTGL